MQGFYKPPPCVLLSYSEKPQCIMAVQYVQCVYFFQLEAYTVQIYTTSTCVITSVNSPHPHFDITLGMNNMSAGAIDSSERHLLDDKSLLNPLSKGFFVLSEMSLH